MSKSEEITPEEGRNLVDKIAEIVVKQQRNFSEGEVRSLHRAMDWISEASKKLEDQSKS